jgi:hypothetical protein
VAAGVGPAVGSVEEGSTGNDLVGELGMGGVDARVEERDLGRPGGCHRAEDLVPAGARQIPLVAVQRIGGDRFGHPRLVRLDVPDLGIGLVARRDHIDIAGGYGDDVEMQRRD